MIGLVYVAVVGEVYVTVVGEVYVTVVHGEVGATKGWIVKVEVDRSVLYLVRQVIQPLVLILTRCGSWWSSVCGSLALPSSP